MKDSTPVRLWLVDDRIERSRPVKSSETIVVPGVSVPQQVPRFQVQREVEPPGARLLWNRLTPGIHQLSQPATPVIVKSDSVGTGCSLVIRGRLTIVLGFILATTVIKWRQVRDGITHGDG